MSDRKHLDLQVLQACFPRTGKFTHGPWRGQDQMMEFMAQNGSCTIESPTGSGKTPVMYAAMGCARRQFGGTCILIEPNKTLVQQTAMEFPDLTVALGRSEHPCLYYLGSHGIALPEDAAELLDDERVPRADTVPCSLLRNCPHRVDTATGTVKVQGSRPCPYLWHKYRAKHSDMVVTTTAFYLFNQLFRREFGEPSILIVNEAHRIAEVVRNVLSYDITDWHVEQSIEILDRIEADEEVDQFREFLKALKRVARRRKKSRGKEELLTDDEIREMIAVLDAIDPDALLRKIEAAVLEGRIDPEGERVVLKKLETLVRDLRRYVHSFGYALSDTGRGPLNYTCAYCKEEMGEHDRVQHRLVIKCYYVAPLVRKILAPLTVAFSATVGKPDIFGYETGIQSPCLSLPSNFPVANTRIYMPSDTPNLAVKERGKRDVAKAVRMVARACKRFAVKGIRSLVVVISNDEREKFLMMAREEGVNAISYGNGVTARAAAQAFKDGEGDVLVGTAANYSEGVDLPKQTAPVIFFLRPGYPNPHDAATQFEKRRFGNGRWAIWNWRVMQQALQVRGRNIRNRSDVGVTFFVSQQFRRVLFAALPKWLEGAYRRDMTWEQAIVDAEGLLAVSD